MKIPHLIEHIQYSVSDEILEDFKKYCSDLLDFLEGGLDLPEETNLFSPDNVYISKSKIS